MAGRHNLYTQCKYWFCDSPHYARHLCASHYQNQLRTSDPLPTRSRDFNVMLDAISLFREAINGFLDNNGGYIVTTDGDITVNCRCKYCGEEAKYKHYVEHKEGCNVHLAEYLLRLTENEPDNEDQTKENSND